MLTAEYGEFVMMDGVVTRVPGQKFEAPKLPDEMRIPDPEKRPKQRLIDHCREVDNVAQMNAIREYNHQKRARQQYNSLRKRYYIQEARSTLSRLGERILSCLSSRSKG